MVDRIDELIEKGGVAAVGDKVLEIKEIKVSALPRKTRRLTEYRVNAEAAASELLKSEVT